LFGRLKGVRKGLEEEAVSLLTKVDLLDVADNTVDTYSGGMRRRLSGSYSLFFLRLLPNIMELKLIICFIVAVAAIGDPLILFLDEFTTGILIRDAHTCETHSPPHAKEWIRCIARLSGVLSKS
jgi:ABC-type lipopolysaccharide export system ATPase subunit